jgi:hypothetical protein
MHGDPLARITVARPLFDLAANTGLTLAALSSNQLLLSTIYGYAITTTISKIGQSHRSFSSLIMDNLTSEH